MRVRGVMWPHCMPSCLHTWLRQYLFGPLPCHVHSSVLPQLTHAVGVVALPLADDIAVLLSACEAASSCWCLDGCGRRRLDAARLRSWLQAPDAGMAVRRRTRLASSVLAISPLAVFSNVLQNSTLAPVSPTRTWAVHRRNKPLSVPPGRCARC